MKAFPVKLNRDEYCYEDCSVEEATHLRLLMEGHFPEQVIPVNGIRKDGPMWTWDGNVDEPTITPSILTTCDTPKKKMVCHSVIIKGIVNYLPDCTHEFAGQQRPLREVR